MPALNVSVLKYTWKGQWTSGMKYVRNDIVQWNNASYVCIQDIPDEYEVVMDISVNNGFFRSPTPEMVLVDRRPDNVGYWKLIVRGNSFRRGWRPHMTYNIGDIVRYGGDLYMYTGAPGFGATATATVSNGSVVGIAITTGGTEYTVAPTVTIIGGMSGPAGGPQPRTGMGAQAFARVSGGAVTEIVVTHGGNGYYTAPQVIINSPQVRNTWVEDTTYWTRVFQNSNQDMRRMYAVAFPNQQPLGWTRNYGDYPNPQTEEGTMLGFIDALGVPYSAGTTGNANSHNTAGRGTRTNANTWQPAGFSFIDWLRSTDNQTVLGLTGLTSTTGLPTPDGLTPRCIQWIKTRNQSMWLFNNGEVYFSGQSSVGESGDGSNATKDRPIRVTNQGTTGFLGETLPRSFNQTRIIKIDCPNVGSRSSTQNTWYALGSDGSMWAWGGNAYGQLGLGQQTPGTGAFNTNQTTPQRIPVQFFDYKRIVDFICFGNEVTSVLAIDEDGDLWGWGADYYGELGLGGRANANNTRPIPTRIPFDFKKFGGIKKMSYYHFSTTNIRAAFILTNDGSLFGAGYFRSATSPLTQTSTIGDITVNRWTRYINTNANVKSIENFWVVGDAEYNVFIREKDTGLMYSMGSNQHGTLGQQSNHQFWTQSGGVSGGWGLVKGPRNVVQITNNGTHSGSNTSGIYLTVVMLEESGRAWGQGRNQRGSLSLNFTGNSYHTSMQNPETGDMRLYQPLYMPGNTRLATIMGQGTNQITTNQEDDLGCYITDEGQILFCGTDGSDSRTGTPNLQGATTSRWYIQNIADPGPFDRNTMHSLLGD